MTVAELIEFLKTQPQDMRVAYGCRSEWCLLEPPDHTLLYSPMRQRELCVARPDGWIQDKRPDMPTETYLVLC